MKFGPAALGAEGLAIILRKAKGDELGICRVVGKTMNTLEPKRSCLWRE